MCARPSVRAVRFVTKSMFEPGKERPGRKIRKKAPQKAKTNNRRKAKAGIEVSSLAIHESEQHVKRRNLELEKYLTATLVEKVIKRAVGDLIAEKFFPSNPYRYLIPRLRRKELEMQIDVKRTILIKNTCMPTTVDKGYVTQIKDYFNVYGSKAVLQDISVDAVGHLFDTIAKLKGLYLNYSEGDPQSTSGQVEVVTALIGPSVFFGSVLPYITDLRLSHELVVTCRKQSDGLRAFTDHILRNYEEFRSSTDGFTRGIHVVQRSRGGGTGIPKLWDQVTIRRNRGEFYRQVQEAVRSKQPIYMDVVVWMKMTPGENVHSGGKMKVKVKRGRIRTVVGAHGVEEDVQSSGSDSDGEGLRGVDRGSHHGGFFEIRKEYTFHYYNKPNVKTKAQSFSNQPYRCLANGIFRSQPAAYRYAEVHGCPEPTKKVYEVYQNACRAEMVNLFNDGNWVPMYEQLLVLVNLAGLSYNAQISQILTSICGQLRQLSLEAATLSKVMDRILHHHGINQNLLELMETNVHFQFKSFYKRNAALVQGGGLGRSSTFAALKLPIRALLDSLFDVRTRELILSDDSVRYLRDIGRMYRTGELSLAADAKELFVTLNVLVEKSVAKVTDARPKASPVNVPKTPRLDVDKETNHNIEINRFPAKIAREAVVCQYFADSHMDTTMAEIYKNLLTEPLYPNPFPHITRTLQGAWARNQLWIQSDDSIEEELFSTPTTCLERHLESQPTCYVESCGKKDEMIFGVHNALSCADPHLLDKLFDHLPILQNSTDASVHMKNNTEHICTALTRDTVIESRITSSQQGGLPSFIECHEHYPIEGAVKRSAIRLFVEHIMMYVKWFQEGTANIVRALSTGACGDESIFTMKSNRMNFNIAQVTKSVATVRRELLKAAADQHGICMHAFVKLGPPFPNDKWIYLRKWFILHWRDPKTECIEHHSQDLCQAIYEDAFFDQTVAEIAMEAQLDPNKFGQGYENPANHSTAMYEKYALATRTEVARCWKVGNLVGAYHALLPYALAHVEDEEIMLDLVRMLRSPAQKLTHFQVENCVLQHLITGFSSKDSDDSAKDKISSATIKRQLVQHRQEVLTVLEDVGDVFVSGSLIEMNSKLCQVERYIGSNDATKVADSVEMLKECVAYMKGIAACIADAVHANCPHINDVIERCVDEYEESLHVTAKDSGFHVDVDHMESQIDTYDDI